MKPRESGRNKETHQGTRSLPPKTVKGKSSTSSKMQRPSKQAGMICLLVPWRVDGWEGRLLPMWVSSIARWNWDQRTLNFAFFRWWCFFGGSQYWDCINAFGLANLFVTQRSQWGEIACSTLYNPGWSLVHNTAETNVRLVYFSQKGWLALVRRKWLMENNRLLLDYMSKYMHLDYI